MGRPVEADTEAPAVDPAITRADLAIDTVNQLCASLDAAMAEFRELVKQRGNNTQTVIHKTAGMGPWAAAAVTACFFTFLGLILLAVVILPDLHDLQAWQDIMRQKIAKLEASK